MDFTEILKNQLGKLTSEKEMYNVLVGEQINRIKASSKNQKERDKRITELCHFASFVISLKYSQVIEHVNEITLSELSIEPDFIITYKGERIGLEIRRVLNDNAQMIGERKNILKLAAKLFESKYPNTKILSNIEFTDDFDERKNNIDSVKNLIADFIYCYHTNQESLRPEFIKSFQCMAHNQVSFNLVGAYAVGTLDTEIVKAIEDKNEKVKQYLLKSNLKKIWLLLVVSGASADSDFSYLNPSDINSDNSFDRVYLLRDLQKEIYFLKKA
jgi:high-affinity Fe2+/Pb2+ permease